MNELARRVGEMLQKESQRLSRQREATEIDAGTGLLLRSPFMARLGAKLESEDADASGSVALVRLSNLARLNQNFGRQTMDAVLAEIGSSVTRLNLSQSDWVAGRLNGSDFCLLAPLANEPKQAAEVKAHWQQIRKFAGMSRNDGPAGARSGGEWGLRAKVTRRCHATPGRTMTLSWYTETDHDTVIVHRHEP